MSNILKGLQLNELSNEKLGQYKKAAGADAKKADSEGNYKRGDKRFSGIVRATKKQFANDAKGLAEGVNHPVLQGWDLMTRKEKREALVAAGLMDWIGDSHLMSTSDLDDFLHSARLKAQNQEDELGMGAGGRRELQQRAEELAEMKRVTLRNERLHDEEVAFQRAETIQQRKDEMKKIADKYNHDLKVINTQHSNNMQAIRTGNDHEINKMNMEYQHEKEMWDKNNPKQEPLTPEYDDEEEYVKPQQSGNKFDQDTGEPIKPNKPQQSNQWHTSQQVGYTPTKPGKKDDDVTDVEPKPNKPLALGNSVKEARNQMIPGELMPVTRQYWQKAVVARYPNAKFFQQKMMNGATIARDESGQVGIYDPKNSYAKVGPSDESNVEEAYNNYHANNTGFSRPKRDLSGEGEPEGMFMVMIDGRPWKEFTSNMAFSRAKTLADKNPSKKIQVRWPSGQLNTVNEGEGRFAGDTPINIGGETVKRLQVGDTVKYFGQKAKILAMSKTGNTSRITIANDMGGVTKDVLTSDLKRTNVDEEKQRLDPKCWTGYKKQGTKMKGDTRVNNCVPVKESAILKGLSL